MILKSDTCLLMSFKGLMGPPGQRGERGEPGLRGDPVSGG